MGNISRHAYVAPSAELADSVRVGAFSYIGPEVKIGSGCVIENNATVIGRTTLGENNHIFPMAVVGADDGDGQTPGELIVGAANNFREHVAVYVGSEQPTRIGADNLIMVDCQVGAGATVGNHCIFANCTHIGERATLSDYVQTSSFASIGPDVMVGAYSFIMGYAGVSHDAPPYAMCQGSPFYVRGVNTPKLKRCGFGGDDISALKSAFRELFNGSGGQVVTDALKRLSSLTDINPHVDRLVQFLKKPPFKRDRK